MLVDAEVRRSSWPISSTIDPKRLVNSSRSIKGKGSVFLAELFF